MQSYFENITLFIIILITNNLSTSVFQLLFDLNSYLQLIAYARYNLWMIMCKIS